MTPLDAMKQALDLMERSGLHVFDDAITNLRAAIKAMEDAEPANTMFKTIGANALKDYLFEGGYFIPSGDEDRITHMIFQRLKHHFGAPVAPEGWKMVPVEPTEEMIVAMTSFNMPENNYKAMLAAAGEPK